MNMCIVMYMNIYISKPNEEWLRKQDGTMSGHINAFLDAEREATPIEMAYDPVSKTVAGIPISKVLETTYAPLPTKEVTTVPTPNYEPAKLKVVTNDDLKSLLGGKATPIKDEPRHACKENCKHWVWDSNSGKYTNSYNGETRDAPEF